VEEWGWPLNPDAPVPSDDELRRLATTDRQRDQDTAREAEAYWEAQARLPWRERDRSWWIGVAFPTVVITLFLLAMGLFITFEL
jgi:CO/xanthine dehydrogenase Mo-binding subunit